MIFQRHFICRLKNDSLNLDFMEQLTNKFYGKCFGNSYIISVDRIIKKSNQYIDFTSIDSIFTIDIEFLATVVIFGINDILVGANVIYNTDQMKICLYEKKMNDMAPIKALIAIQPNKQSENLILGHKIIVQVRNVQYDPFAETISISAILLTCEKTYPIYKIIGSLNEKSLKELKDLLPEINRELTIRNSLSEKQKEKLFFLEKLFYSFKNEKKDIESNTLWYGPKIENSNDKINILDYVENLTEETKLPLYCFRNLYIYKSSPFVMFLEDLKHEDLKNVIEVHPSVVFNDILISIRNFLIMGREFVELFDDEIINNQKSIWRSISNLQS
jgi:hypothetical protein